jgi:hypothetical protein
MPRFVIQQHSCEKNTHWDLMLEKDGSLATWRVVCPPGKWGGKKVQCCNLFNHQIRYLSYQGPLSDNRGQVLIAAAGTYQPQKISQKCWRVALKGDKINGLLELEQKHQDHWEMRFTGECSC